MKRIVLFFLVAAATYAQPLSFGIKGGIPATDLGKNNAGFMNGRFTLGPTIELHLPFHLSVEFDALYRSLDYRVDVVQGTNNIGGASWQFPLLAKYRFERTFVSPFVAAGIAFNHITGLERLGNLKKSTVEGVVFGAGLEGKLLFIRISPELRYTHWNSSNLQNAAGASLSNQNQFEALVGITF